MHDKMPLGQLFIGIYLQQSLVMFKGNSGL